MLTPESLRNFAAAIVYSLLGIAIFAISFLVVDRLTPGSLWEELIKDRNVAVAILFAGFSIALGIIIAAAIS